MTSEFCPECSDQLTRRGFVRQLGTTAAAAGALPMFVSRNVVAAPSRTTAAETAVGELYKSLSAEQLSAIRFPFDNKLRQKIRANWSITKHDIGSSFYTDKQRLIITEIVKGIMSPDGYGRLVRQMDFDAGGMDNYSVALFGDPDKGAFEWELTGRHLTMRADGNSVNKAAFGGPIVYGHGEEDPKKNLYYFQTEQVNEVFGALDSNQAGQALLDQVPKETNVKVQGNNGSFAGISVGDLSSDQKELVQKTLRVLMAQYRDEDIDEAMEIVKANGGVDGLRMAFYRKGDLHDDRIWDMWRIEGPAFVWHFRGAPHVHAYINIGVVENS